MAKKPTKADLEKELAGQENKMALIRAGISQGGANGQTTRLGHRHGFSTLLFAEKRPVTQTTHLGD